MAGRIRDEFQGRYDGLLTESKPVITPNGGPPGQRQVETHIVRRPAAASPGFHPATFLSLGSQVFRQYTDKAFEIVTKNRPVVPWMKWREIEVIQEILTRLRPKKCLEWGSGYSTAYFPRFIPSYAEWISIEHDESWAGVVGGITKNPKVRLTHVPPDRFPFTDALGEGTADDLRTYVTYPGREGSFDFVLVDGRARMDCVAQAATILDPQGVMVMHDANRAMYTKSSQAFHHQILFSDHRTDTGGLWICSIGRSLDSILDTERHGRLWSLYTLIGKTSAGRILRV